jgi:transcriptional regulator with XRE-family HTH domain
VGAVNSRDWIDDESDMRTNENRTSGIVDTAALIQARGQREPIAVAIAANVPGMIYTQIESGKLGDPKVSEMYRIAQALEVPIEKLLVRTEHC